MVIAAAVILIGVVAIATGRGGEMSYERADYAPVDMGPVSATDVVLLRPPTALWGYNMQVTDEALEHIAAAIRERDVRIVALEQRLADLRVGRLPTAGVERPASPEPSASAELSASAESSASAEPPTGAEPPASAEPPAEAGDQEAAEESGAVHRDESDD